MSAPVSLTDRCGSFLTLVRRTILHAAPRRSAWEDKCLPIKARLIGSQADRMSGGPSESSLPVPDPEGKKPADLSALFPKPIDMGLLFPKINMSLLLPKPIDVSALIMKIDLSAFVRSANLSALFTGVDSALVLPTLDPSTLFPTVDLQPLIAQVGAFALPRAIDQNGGVEVGAENQSTAPSRQAAAIVTAFVFFIVFIGLTLMVQDLSQIAKISQLTGANPFDVAMGFGALAFWIAYSRRRS